MQPIFTIQYGEYYVANYIKSKLKNCSVFVPMSAQEKGVDLIVYRFNNRNKMVTIQVKTSRTYNDIDKSFDSEDGKTIDGYISMWFNRYEVPANAEWNILLGIYQSNENENLPSKEILWKHVLLAFKKNEMKKFMSDVKTKKGKDDRFFGFAIDGDDIYWTRGNPKKPKNMNKYKIENRLSEIDKQLG